MEIVITYHAIERFQQRIVRGLPFDDAKKLLWSAAQTATQMKAKTVKGHSLWAVETPPMRLVIKDTEDGPLCVTILPPEEAGTESLELLQDLSEEASRRSERKREESFAIPPPGANQDPSEIAVMEEHRKILQLEASILSSEVARYREREKTLRHQISAESEELRKALKWAVRALQGETSEKEALLQIKEINLAWVSPVFYQEKSPSDEADEEKDELSYDWSSLRG
jgi:hypothetical protein